jgi:tetratricopeptide (TPR) repeat protein
VAPRSFLSRSIARRWSIALLLAPMVLGGGCAGASAGAVSGAALDEVRIAARQTEDGYAFERVRVRGLFYEALDLAQAGRHDEAARLFDRIVEQFPGSRYMPSALFDAAVCMERLGQDAQAAARYERLVRWVPRSSGTARARMAAAEVLARLRRWDRAQAHLGAVLAEADLRPTLRLEALVQRARLVLAMERFPDAEARAAEALAYDPASTVGATDDDRALVAALHAEATFLEAESYRLRAAAVPLARSGDRPRRERLAERGRLMLEAQRLYFETLRRGEPRWAEEAGARLVALYRDLRSELPAPVGAPRAAPPIAPVEASDGAPSLSAEVAELVRVGLRNADLALRQMERLDQVPSSFTARVRAELAEARAQLEPEDAAAASAEHGAPRDL